MKTLKELWALRDEVLARKKAGVPAMEDPTLALWLIEEQRMSHSWTLIHDWVMADPLDRSLQYPAHLSDGRWESVAHHQAEEIKVAYGDTPTHSIHTLCVGLGIVPLEISVDDGVG